MAYLIAAFTAQLVSRYESTGSRSYLQAYKGACLDLTQAAAMFLLPAILVIAIYGSIAAANLIPVASIALGLFATGVRLHLLAYSTSGHWHLKTVITVIALFFGLSAVRFIG